jgi:hypothetical protein
MSENVGVTSLLFSCTEYFSTHFWYMRMYMHMYMLLCLLPFFGRFSIN